MQTSELRKGMTVYRAMVEHGRVRVISRRVVDVLHEGFTDENLEYHEPHVFEPSLEEAVAACMAHHRAYAQIAESALRGMVMCA